ncbi:MAG: ubiquinone/menaquinone biosynthesis methyltransferase [Candidatus Thorarchaeota archaeon]|jgi:demethylmenaquinone methyltransferase/2-methoxy-6-polyprenyl-1,4-benzoquinol methylase
MSKGVQKIYAEASSTYEMINHLLTLGLDILWRKKTSELVVKFDGTKWLDVCSGTGEMAISLQKVASPQTSVISADFSLPMLRDGKNKSDARDIQFSLADAGNLPFRDDAFDLITISYATRNLNPSKERLIEYLKEFRRVLKPGGVFINLETSQPDNRIIREIYHLYVRLGVRRIGELISGSRTGYSYLSYTVRNFYGPIEFAEILKQAGFRDIRVSRMLFGAFAIHQAKV